MTAKPLNSAFVWRLEDREGRGIYQSPEIDIETLSDYRKGGPDTNRPAPHWDHIKGSHKTIDKVVPLSYFETMLGLGPRFGFSSVEQARAWFDNPADLAAWGRQGLRLSAYPRDALAKVWDADHQSVFKLPGDPEEGLPAHADFPPSALFKLTPEELENQARKSVHV